MEEIMNNEEVIEVVAEKATSEAWKYGLVGIAGVGIGLSVKRVLSMIKAKKAAKKQTEETEVDEKNEE